MSSKVVLTGVKPTGTVHIGNYVGAIRPALKMAQDYKDSLFFIANYHALTSIHDSKVLAENTNHVAAAWLACGLDPQKTIIYKQSDVPEIFEISWILSCFCPKGLMNRAHAYKAKVQQNQNDGKSDLDFGVNMGLYLYPVLMASDILSFDTDSVPVGEDQIQHLEIARDIAQKINHTYKSQLLKIPEAIIQKDSKIIPGLDGQKMSKSYDNVIPLFCESSKLRKLIMKIKTDSKQPNEPKSTEDSVIFQLFKEFASSEEVKSFEQEFLRGIAWGDAKQKLFEVIDRELSPMREKYNSYIQNPNELNDILKNGAQKARARSQAVLSRLKKSLGV